ncbi:hypothetical protein B0H12DRAFT_1071054 [Mycena haematopus]|nr:hypothetical protein B0H12DRAFT_1071054 [Mycena haematopus]
MISGSRKVLRPGPGKSVMGRVNEIESDITRGFNARVVLDGRELRNGVLEVPCRRRVALWSTREKSMGRGCEQEAVQWRSSRAKFHDNVSIRKMFYTAATLALSHEGDLDIFEDMLNYATIFGTLEVLELLAWDHNIGETQVKISVQVQIKQIVCVQEREPAGGENDYGELKFGVQTSSANIVAERGGT